MKLLPATHQLNTIKRLIGFCNLPGSRLSDYCTGKSAGRCKYYSRYNNSRQASRPTVVGDLPPSKNGPGAKIIPAAENLKCTVTVHSYWDDDAYQAMLVVVVPVEVSIISHPANATVYKAGGTSPWAGYLVFNLGNMAVQQSITVEFTFTKSTTGTNKVSAFAYSATPDPNPANNYKDATF